MSQGYDYVEMKIPAKAEFMRVIRLTASGIASRIGFSIDDIEDIKIAISEACTNVVQHAYEEDEEGDIIIGFGVYENHLEMMVADNGHSCNFDEIRCGIGPYSKDMGVEFMREGGLGLFLIETLMDEVKIHQHNGVTVFMTKFVQKEQVEANAKTSST